MQPVPAALRRARYAWRFALLTVSLVGVFLLELAIGSTEIPLPEISRVLLGGEPAEPVTATILYELRLPRAITALTVGAALGAAGLLLQTLFRNPLAGPWALGITAGAQLGVALVVVTGNVVGSSVLEHLAILNQLSLVAGASLGSGSMIAAITVISRRVSTITLLIVGLMLGFFAQGLVAVVLHFTDDTQARIFASWNDGSFAGVEWRHFPTLLPLLGAGMVLALAMVKPLNALLLGESHADTLGVSLGPTRLAILGSAVLLAAPATAYCGPILFVGLIVPHLCRGLFKTSDHRVLMPAVLLVGSLLALSADLLVNLPWEHHFLHLNSINALIGAPVVIWVVLRDRHMRSLVL
ncbi:MAG: iron ABC transporter permease [Holophagales bacterium]|nr:iron ABC transporter permease [Holophagales bacterium]